MKPCREGIRVAAVVVPCCHHSHRPPLSRCVPHRVTAITPPIEGGWGCTPQPLSPPLRMGYPCCCGHCVVTSSSVHLSSSGCGCLPLLPSSSLVSCPAVVVTVGAWWVDVAVSASPLILMVVWSPRSSLWSWCPPWVPPAHS